MATIQQRLQQVDIAKFGGWAIILVIAFGIVSYAGLQSLFETTNRVKHSHDVTNKAAAIEKMAVDMETGQRGFLITGSDEYLQPYNFANQQIFSSLSALKYDVRDVPDQMHRLQQVETLINQWIEKSGGPEIFERRKVKEGLKDALYLQKVLKRGVGKNILDNIRKDLKYIDSAFEKAGNHQARTLVILIAKDMVEMESGERGFLVTGEDTFLDPFYSGLDALGMHFSKLHLLVDNAFDINMAKKTIKTLQKQHSLWHEMSAEPLIDLRINIDNNKGQRRELLDKVEAREGEKYISSMNQVLSNISTEFEKSNNLKAAQLIALMEKSLWQQESGLRGFLLTGNNIFLESFNKGEDGFNERLFQLQMLVNNAYSREEISRVLINAADKSQQWMDKAAEPEISAREEMNVDKTTMQDITLMMKSGVGKNIMDEIRKTMQNFKQLESNLLMQREEDYKKTYLAVVSVVFLATVLMVLFAIVLLKTSKTLKSKSADVENERIKLEDQDWIKSGIAAISENAQNEKNIQDFADVVLAELVPLVNCQMGLFYIRVQKRKVTSLDLIASIAHTQRKNLCNSFKLGEGLVGQSALEQKQILLMDVPDDYIKITSGLGDASPNNILVFPIVFESKILAVIELAALKPFSNIELQLIDQLQKSLGVITNNILTQQKTKELLNESQEQTQLLAENQHSLEMANVNLEDQTRRLKKSEENLQHQSEELRISNQQLTKKQEDLEVQKSALEKSKQEVEVKVSELAESSKYKSEFLANMSHELRTPLNSLLILSKLLMKNKEGNLTESQCEDIQVIYEGGNDLLELINDIMDLSKVEAGMLSVHFEKTSLTTIADSILTLFKHIAKSKGLAFSVEISSQLNNDIITDGQRLEQVLKNFLSNAFKFTKEGSITLHIHPVEASTELNHQYLPEQEIIAFTVMDTGVGIAPEKQQAIFEAFQQEDGSTSRKYGGTGLGLAISREMAALLGGEIGISSEQGKGSQFTLYLPISANNMGRSEQRIAAHSDQSSSVLVKKQIVKPAVKEPVAEEPKPAFIDDDRRNIGSKDHVILIVEDDKVFAKVLLRLARDSDYKCLVSDQGRDAISLAQRFKPKAILLDIGLPDIDGLQVLEQLKNNLDTRHIPVHMVSGGDYQQASLQQGAYRFLKKPVDDVALMEAFSKMHTFNENTQKHILIIDDKSSMQEEIIATVAMDNIDFCIADSAQQSLDKLAHSVFDCIIVDANMADMPCAQILQKIFSLLGSRMPPVVIYSAEELPQVLVDELEQLNTNVVIKEADSSERLLDEVSLFLHSMIDELPIDKKATLDTLHNEDAMLEGRHVLLVDDDMRNVFALSRQLEEVGIDVCMGENGQAALDVLNDRDDIELILMDIMMPVMDGYEACREIRKMAKYQQVPIIALTAKAMPEDKQKCIDAGASEYLSKPVDLDKLLSLLRVWLYPHE